MTLTDARDRQDLSHGSSSPAWACIDGNEAVARVAYALSEMIAIYPITPASPMGEAADAWHTEGRPNLWGATPAVVEMQSEGGAAGALHGALAKGSLSTTFTSSQGLLLMLPNMFKIAGELTPAVIHVAARTVATHALSIFGDHSDVMAARSTGWAMLCSRSVQEAQDFALVAHAATLEARVPFLHFFDGFRTSHEINRIELLADADLRALVRPDAVDGFRRRGLAPEHPVLRGSAQNPDVFFQAREACNRYYDAVPGIVREQFDRLAAQTGRRYHLVDYHGHPKAERVVVVMGSGSEVVEQAVDRLVATGERVGVATVRLFRPFPVDDFVAALPTSVRALAVLDRTKEPGAVGEPLYTDVVAALAEAVSDGRRPLLPHLIGGRFGLSSKEFTPAMAKAVFDELGRPKPKRHFTVGIIDDVTHLSLPVDPTFDTDDSDVRAVFYGLGSDGTVSANKAAVKLVGEQTEHFAQGYFVYDSKKSGSTTVSHLRFSSQPIHSPYLVGRAGFVACHQFSLLDRLDVLSVAERGATVLLNSPYPAERVWDHLPVEVQAQIITKELRLFVIDAHRVAREVGLGNRTNAVLLPCFFALSRVLPLDEAIKELKGSFAKSYGKRGREVVERNNRALDVSIHSLQEVAVPRQSTAPTTAVPLRVGLPAELPDFAQRVTARLIAGEGDLLPVSALPADGTFPTGTARYEKRALAQEIPIWDPEICTDCAKCTIVCPHAAIRLKVYDPATFVEEAEQPERLESAELRTKPFRSKDLKGHLLAIQVAPDDCTGCGVCVDVCPAHRKGDPTVKALRLEPAIDHRNAERRRWEAFLQVPHLDRDLLPHDSVKGSQVLEPLFEFSGACAGCGETPYLKLLTQLFGDRLLVANATGCSSIYGGNLPTTPWAPNAQGCGPAWENSLFEDNAEFGLGIRVAADHQHDLASGLLHTLAGEVGNQLVADLVAADQTTESGIQLQRARVDELRRRLARVTGAHAGEARALAAVADELVRRSVWIVGGDGWAYDIGFGGLDHVLASGEDVNVLVLDTEVYSNTGGQASKSTPRGAVAKFATSGKLTAKKDLGMIAMAYGNVYVAQVALGANDVQTVKAFNEAEAWPGPSLILAYSTCIAHGIEMSTSMSHQKEAVKSGYWPLYRYHPGVAEHEHPFHMDSKAPTIPVTQFLDGEARYAMLRRDHPDAAGHLQAMLQADVDERQRFYGQLSTVERTVPHDGDELGADQLAEAEGEPGHEEDGGT